MQVLASLVSSLLIIVAISTTIECEPEPMARPTRPKVFTSAEELRQYLDLIKEYYSVSGKARYGKRGMASSVYLAYPWDALRLMLETRRQLQKEEKMKQAKDQIFHGYQNPDINKQLFQMNSQPTYFNHVMDKSYDDIE